MLPPFFYLEKFELNCPLLTDKLSDLVQKEAVVKGINHINLLPNGDYSLPLLNSILDNMQCYNCFAKSQFSRVIFRDAKNYYL